MDRETELDIRKIIKFRIFMFLTILTVMISGTVIQNRSHATNVPYDDVVHEVDQTMLDSAGQYAGIFSTAVTASVNPTATLAVVSIIGVMENGATYCPESKWVNACGNQLSKIPFVGTIKDLPISNPTAMVILVIIAVTMYVVHSTAVSKMFSNATLDKIEHIGGLILLVAMSLLPAATQEVVEAASSSTVYVTQGTHIMTLFLAILVAIFNAVAYFCIYGAIDAIEVIAAAIPIKGMNVIVQIAKMILHLVLVLLQIFCLPLSIAMSVIVMIIGIILFVQLRKQAIYYTYIYLRPLFDKVFRNKKPLRLIHKKFPRRGRRRYPDTEFAIPVFSMNTVKGLKKRKLAWLVIKDQKPVVLVFRFIRKPKEITFDIINSQNEVMYLEKKLAYIRLRSESKEVEVVMSVDYAKEWERLLASIGVDDYQMVVDRKKEEKEMAKSARKQRWQDRLDRLDERWKFKYNRLEKKDDDDIIVIDSE